MTDPLAPYIPTPEDPWDRKKAAHLARRAGFAAPPEAIERLVQIGPDAAVSRYVDFPDEDPALEEAIERQGAELAPPEAKGSAGEATERLRRRWIYRMAHGAWPLQEKLTLFWHDHFACQESKVVRARLLMRQNETLRRLAAAPFRDLLFAVARDPAMLVYLDNRISPRDNPNENWARELLELFTLGVDRYTQRDVRELARIFTGWSTPAADSEEFVFVPDEHDDGDKILFGRVLEGRSGPAGIEEGEEALDRIVAREECAAFLARKLLGWFLTHEPEDALVSAFAAVLRAGDLSIREAMRALFRSRAFYAPRHRFARYRNPIDIAIAAARALEIQNAHLCGLEVFARRMGMDLFEPPSVDGWRHGPAWASTGVALQRAELALHLSSLPHSRRRVTGRAVLNLDRLMGAATPDDPKTLVRALGDRILNRRLDPERENALSEFALEGGTPATGASRSIRDRVRALIHLFLQAPEFAVE